VTIPAVLYAAKSTQDVHKSIDTQLEDGREKAAEEGWVVVGEFVDENFSAYTGNRGPGLEDSKRLAAKAAEEFGESCMLVAQASDRFARGAGDRPGAAESLVEIWHAMRRQSVHLRSVEDDFDLRDSASVANLGHRAMMESRRKSGAVKKGNKRRVANGLPVGTRALALNPTEVGYEIVHDEVSTVLRIFDEYFSGTSQLRIAANLEADSVPTVRGGKWYQATVRAVLQNPAYKGCVTHLGEALPGRHPPLIPIPKWDAVAQMMERKARSKGKGRGRPTKGLHLFEKGMLRAECGAPLIPRTIANRASDPYEVYLCFDRVRDVHACDEGPYRRDAIDTAVYHYFEQVGLSVEATREQLARLQRSHVEDVGAYLARAEADRREAEDRLARVRSDYLEGRLGAEDWSDFRDDLTAGIAAATAKVERLTARLEDAASQGELADLEAATLRHLAEIRRAVAGEIDDREGIAAVRAALTRTFEGFRLRKVQPGMRVHAELAWQGDHVIEPIIREDAIQADAEGDRLHPNLRREPVYGRRETINGPGSRSSTRNCAPGSPPSCAAATAATRARSGSASCWSTRRDAR
jgi:DNA invertase Pin-like site-specific DNA recombinase